MRRASEHRVIRAAVVGLSILMATGSPAATASQKCSQGMNKEAGKYGYCRHKAVAKFAIGGIPSQLTADLDKCLAKYQAKWGTYEAKAVAAGGVCLSVGDQNVIQTAIDTCTADVAAVIGGIAPSSCAADLAVCQTEPHGRPLQTGQTGCWDSAGSPIACAGTGQDGDLQPGLSRAWQDNGNGTVTDLRSGLTWEKLSDDGSIHDKDNTYTWDDAFAVKIAGLNGASFAGQTDWRVPSINELKSLADYSTASPAVATPFDMSCAPTCTVISCSCTSTDSGYWSSTSYQPALIGALIHDFDVGLIGAFGKTTPTYVRGVRGP